jgi:hypothetical protein
MQNRVELLKPTLEVFAAACAAQRINGMYVSKKYSTSEKEKTLKFNRLIMQSLLGMNVVEEDYQDEILDEDREQAQVIINYYQSKTFDIMSGKANTYTINASGVSFKTEIDVNDGLLFNLIASLPNAYLSSNRYDKIWDKIDHLKRLSNHFGLIGEKYTGKIEVLSCIYSKNWFKYYITGLTEQGNIVNFACDKEVEIDQYVQILSSKIKQHCPGNITRLHYVRYTVDKESN